MEDDYIDYGKLIDAAMHDVVRATLRIVDEYGLTGDNHFFITFKTKYAGVMVTDDSLTKYPDEMTIVVQNQYWDLEIEEERFSIVLSFEGVKHSLTIPFDALISFADPSVKFSLQFHHDARFEDEDEVTLNFEEGNDSEKPVTYGSNIVTLDAFRKK